MLWIIAIYYIYLYSWIYHISIRELIKMTQDIKNNIQIIQTNAQDITMQENKEGSRCSSECIGIIKLKHVSSCAGDMYPPCQDVVENILLCNKCGKEMEFKK